MNPLEPVNIIRGRDSVNRLYFMHPMTRDIPNEALLMSGLAAAPTATHL